MCKFSLFIAITVIAIGCKSNILIIEGQVPDKYNSQTIFLVPRPYPEPSKVDSTKIINGRFKFRAMASSVHMCDITISRKANARIEKLLVAIEPGKLHVKMDTVSCAYGTPLNDDLQKWKEAMNISGRKALGVTQKSQQQEIYDDFGKTTFEFVKRNVNPMGGYIFMMMEPLFDSGQITELKNIGIEKWKPINN